MFNTNIFFCNKLETEEEEMTSHIFDPPWLLLKKKNLHLFCFICFFLHLIALLRLLLNTKNAEKCIKGSISWSPLQELEVWRHSFDSKYFYLYPNLRQINCFWRRNKSNLSYWCFLKGSLKIINHTGSC